MVTVPQRKAVVSYLRGHYPISDRRACAIAQLHRSVQRYQSTRPSQEALRRRIREIAATRVRYGYRRIHVLPRREGWQINRKRVHRLLLPRGPATTGQAAASPCECGASATTEARRRPRE